MDYRWMCSQESHLYDATRIITIESRGERRGWEFSIRSPSSLTPFCQLFEEIIAINIIN